MAEDALSLVATLFANNQPYDTAMKNSAKVTEDAAKGMSSSFSELGEQAGGFLEGLELLGPGIGLVAGAAGLGALLKSALETGEALSIMSRQTGVGVEVLQELHFAADQAGVSHEALDSALNRLNRDMGEAAAGNKAVQVAFDALGISLMDVNGTAKTSDEVFSEVSDAIKNAGSSAERAAIGQALFGRNYAQMIPLLEKGSQNLKIAADEAKNLGAVLSKETVTAAEEANIRLKVMSDVIGTQLKTAILTLAPAVKILADGFMSLANGAAWVAKQFASSIGLLDDFKDKTTGLTKEQTAANAALIGASVAAANVATATEKEVAGYAAKKKVLEDIDKILSKGEKPQGPADDVATLQKGIDMKLDKEGKFAAEMKKIQAKMASDAVTTNHDQNAKEVQNILQKNDELRADGASMHAEELATNQATIDTLMTQENIGADNLLKLRHAVARDEQKTDKALAASKMETLNGVAALSHSKNAEMAAIGKAASAAQIGISTYEGAIKAYASLAGIPIVGPALGAAAATAISLYGAEQLAGLAGVDVGFASGADVVPGGSNQVGGVVHGGERVVDTKTNRMLEKQLRSGSFGGGKLEISLKGDLANWLEVRFLENGRVKKAQGTLNG
jgi:hypothetical protein